MAKRIASGACASANSWLMRRASASRVALHDAHRLREVLAGAAARAQDVELLLGQAADADRRLFGGHAHLDGAAGRGDHVDHGPHRRRHAGGVDDDRTGRRRRPTRARRRPPRPRSSIAASRRRARGPAPAGSPAGRRAAPRRRARAATTATHWPIGPAPSTTTRSPDRIRPRCTAWTATETGSASAASAPSAAWIGKTCSCGRQSSSWRPPSVWMPTSAKLSQAFGRPTLHG